MLTLARSLDRRARDGNRHEPALGRSGIWGLGLLVFQEGIGNELLGLREAETIDAWVPLFLFAVLFELSMDYQVFLLSRIRALRADRRHGRRHLLGIGSTARLITGAALIIIAVFWGFAMGDTIAFQQMGFGVAVAAADRRHDRPLRPCAGNDETPGRAQLVPALLAELAPGRTRRGRRAPVERRPAPGSGRRNLVVLTLRCLFSKHTTTLGAPRSAGRPGGGVSRAGCSG